MNIRPRGRHRVKKKRLVRRAMKSRSKSVPDISLYPFPGMLKTFVTAIRSDQWHLASLTLREMLEMVMDGESVKKVGASPK